MRQPEIPEQHRHFALGVAQVEEADRQIAVRQHFDEDEHLVVMEPVRLRLDPVGAAPFDVLIDGDQIPVQQNVLRRLARVADIAADHERGSHHGPEREVGPVLDVGAAADLAADEGVVAAAVHADDEHVQVVVAERSRIRRLVELGDGELFDGIPEIADVDGRPVRMGAGFADPVVHIVRAPVAGGEENVATAVLEGEAHPLVHQLAGNMAGLEAVIVLKEIDAPFGEQRRILELMLEAARIAGASVGADAGIHAELQAFGVDIIGQRFHPAGEFGRIGHKIAVGIPFLQAPAVVDDDIFVAGIFIAIRHE